MAGCTVRTDLAGVIQGYMRRSIRIIRGIGIMQGKLGLYKDIYTNYTRLRDKFSPRIRRKSNEKDDGTRDGNEVHIGANRHVEAWKTTNIILKSIRGTLHSICTRSPGYSNVGTSVMKPLDSTTRFSFAILIQGPETVRARSDLGI